MLLADFGTSYCKLLETGDEASRKILATRDLNPDFRVDLATGHNASRRSRLHINELTALAWGGEKLIPERDFVLLDCGSRDIKFVRYQNGRPADMGWNAECGASMGFTIELLGRYYNLDFSELSVPDRGFPVTCGVLGMSSIFDAVVAGASETEAVARFVKGIAMNAYRFAGSPARLYLSGGLCGNQLFVGCFPCEVLPLGRFVLLTGLEEYMRRQKENTA
jgi:activator of 2-hydroxyglutaryl-CoA dehydratase